MIRLHSDGVGGPRGTKSSREGGFTLIEVLLYVAIAGVVATVAFQALALFDSAQARSSARISVDTEASFLEARIHDLLRAGTADVPDSQETSAVLELDNGTIVGLDDWTVTVTRGGIMEPLTSERVTVSGLSFQDVSASGSPDLIRIAFTVTASPSGPVFGASYSHDYTSTIGIR